MTTLNVRSADPEVQRAAILANPVFLAMVTATPAQINTYLNTNVTSLAQAIPILSMYGQAIAYLFNVQNPTS